MTSHFIYNMFHSISGCFKNKKGSSKFYKKNQESRTSPLLFRNNCHVLILLKKLLNIHRVYFWQKGVIYEAIYLNLDSRFLSAFYRTTSLPISVKIGNNSKSVVELIVMETIIDCEKHLIEQLQTFACCKRSHFNTLKQSVRENCNVIRAKAGFLAKK